MSGYTLSDRHSRALRAVVEASKLVDPQLAVSPRVLENLRELIGCDHVMIEGCDYGAGATYFSQRYWGGENSFSWDVPTAEKRVFWSTVRSASNALPFIPVENVAAVTKPTDYRSVRQWRDLPVYVDWLRQGPGTTYELFMQVPDGYRRQLRLICWRESGRDFNERERFDLELLLPHIVSAYRAGERQRDIPQLTPRQYELLQGVREGWTNQQIAHRMDLAEGTVRTHLNNIYARIGVQSRTEAVTRVFAHESHA
jgi:DNA-binding CsgD family transcriptional regulator